MKYYIARDKENKTLCVHGGKPYRDGKIWASSSGFMSDNVLILPKSHHKDITWDNSPVEVEIKLKETPND